MTIRSAEESDFEAMWPIFEAIVVSASRKLSAESGNAFPVESIAVMATNVVSAS